MGQIGSPIVGSAGHIVMLQHGGSQPTPIQYNLVEDEEGR